ncbi:MAG: hypothetical protein ACM3TR_16985 [Caulobacteraceae bacterium]
MNNNVEKEKFDLELIQKDRIGNILFIIGILFAWSALDKLQQSITGKQTQQSLDNAASTPPENPAKALALSNWIYLIAGLIFLTTAYVRLKEDIAVMSESPSPSSKKLVTGHKIVTIGNFFKTIGYTTAAIGNEVIAASS